MCALSMNVYHNNEKCLCVKTSKPMLLALLFNTSSNIIEGIKAVWVFFYEKISLTKSTKQTKKKNRKKQNTNK